MMAETASRGNCGIVSTTQDSPLLEHVRKSPQGRFVMRLKFLVPDRVAYLLVPLFFVVSISAFAQTEHTLHRFQPNTDGSQPLAGLVADSSGNLYGTASDYGLGSSLGTIFEMSPPTPGGVWTFTTLYSITDYTTDGAVPWAGLIRDSAGNLYGTTEAAGPKNTGPFLN